MIHNKNTTHSESGIRVISPKPPHESKESFSLDNNNDSSNTNMNAPSWKSLQENVPLVSPKETHLLFFTKGVTNDEVQNLPQHNSSEDAKDKRPQASIVERVKVQLMQSHSQLQNNVYNHPNQPLSSFTSEREIEFVKNIQNESAFDDKNNVTNTTIASAGRELQQTHQVSGVNTIGSDRQASPICRTEDQENAFRLIEDVHNYAKLNCCSYSNGSSNSSNHEDDEFDDDEDDEEDDVEDEHDDDQEINECDDFYENKMLKRNSSSLMKFSANCIHNAQSPLHVVRISQENVVTAPNEFLNNDVCESSVDIDTVKNDEHDLVCTPDHHARRPMNAFLIFCKRHRTIVKDKYKTCENRAITKILGDWWASLDANDKKCYTNLAKQNKDAFFSANPNFKWYKLPAPPLRTLISRPSNLDRTTNEEYILGIREGKQHQTLTSYSSDEMLQKKSRWGRSIHLGKNSNYFKLADEAQMGELNALMCPSSNEMPVSPTSSNALQKVLGETSDFLETKMPQSESAVRCISGKKRKNSSNIIGPNCKRLQHDYSFSSNSSEEEIITMKSSRSCKGKKYQEFIKSGQIASIPKKFKLTTKTAQQFPNTSTSSYNEITTRTPHQFRKTKFFPKTMGERLMKSDSFAIDCSAIEVQKSPTTAELLCSSETATFDLEDKIKALPALSLDVYLQRKRNSKKKKKINSKKRVPPIKTPPPASTSTITATKTRIMQITQHPEVKESVQMVGSQKRKARKESITRRYVNTMETVDALSLELSGTSFNGRYYYDEILIQNSKPTNVTTLTTNVATHPANNFPDIRTINNNISSTSDLLILAEVAANRTEKNNS